MLHMAGLYYRIGEKDMYPTIKLLGREISSYGLMTMIGMIVVFIAMGIRYKIIKKNYNAEAFLLAFCFMFSPLGAIILYQLTIMPTTLKYIKYLFTDFAVFKEHFSFGMVYYGGLFGLIAGAFVYAKVFKVDARDDFSETAVCIPLFHVFGRIGCFLAGCCYGMESEKLGVFFKNAVNVPHDIPYLPIQLYEAAGNFVIFLILLFTQKYNRRKMSGLGKYFVIYGTMRFVLEFFRGDEVRGIWGPFSTSQWISLILIPIGIYCFIAKDENNWFCKRLNKAKTVEEKNNPDADE